jgi:hypothetical protein
LVLSYLGQGRLTSSCGHEFSRFIRAENKSIVTAAERLLPAQEACVFVNNILLSSVFLEPNNATCAIDVD